MARFGIKEVADVIFYDLANGGKPALFLDSLKLSNLENDAETSYVTGGKSNGRIMSFDYNRTATFALQDALMNPKAMAMQAGTEIQKGTTNVHKREHIAVTDNAGVLEVSLAETPIAGESTVYVSADGYDHGEEVGITTEDQTMVLDETGMDTPIVAGDMVLVYYKYATQDTSEQVVISSDKFSGFYKIVGQTVAKSTDNKLEQFEIEIGKARIASNWSINLSADGEPAVFDMNLDVLKPDSTSEMIKITRIG